MSDETVKILELVALLAAAKVKAKEVYDLELEIISALAETVGEQGED